MAVQAKKKSEKSSERQWPADHVERRKVSDLVPYARNARTHSPEQVDQIAASIKEWGWTTPVLCDEDGGIIAGHGRVLAAQKLNITDVPVMVAKGWSEAQKRAYVLADNKLTINSEWNDDLLRIELTELQDAGFDFTLTGFNTAEFAKLFAPTSDVDPLAEWEGMPEFTQEDKNAAKRLVVNFRDIKDFEAFGELIGQKMTPETRTIWHPIAEPEKLIDKEYS